MADGKKNPKTLSDRMRDAVLASGKTLYRVTKDSGISYATLHGFMHRRRGVGMDSLDKLYAYLEQKELI
jgi:hypothetical protein